MEDLFGGYWMVRFILYNVLKLFTGFIHSYFYYQPQLQATLLLILFLLRFLLYIFTIKKIKDKFEYIIDILTHLLIVTLQTFLFAEEFIIDNGDYSS
jgi:hypothetical protein